jgi:hypothetical protein
VHRQGSSDQSVVVSSVRVRLVPRAFVALALALAAVVATPAVGWAHNTRPGFSGTYGPYTVLTQLVYVHDNGPNGVAFDVFLQDAATGSAVTDATVTVTATNGSDTVGPLTATHNADDYGVVIPDETAQQWNVEVHVSVPRGDTTITGTILGAGVLKNDVSSQITPSAPPMLLWLTPIVVIGIGIAALGAGRQWKATAVVAGALLLVAAGVVLAGSWQFSPGSSAGFLAAAAPTIIFAAVLVAGLAQLRRRAGTALVFVFVGAGGLTLLQGWANISSLTTNEVASTFAPAAARVSIVAVLALGLGLLLLVLVRNRSTLRALLPQSTAVAD